MSDFTAIGQLVTEARNLLDSIKGGAIRTMQTQFDALKVQFSDKLTAVSGDLNTFVNQEKGKVASIFSDPDSRYQKIQPVTFMLGGDTDKFYPVVFGSTNVNRITEVHIGRFIHADGSGKGAMYAKFTASSYAWGARSSTMILDVLKTLVDRTSTSKAEQVVIDDGFVGGYRGSTTHPHGVVVWLRGGYSYEAWSTGSRLTQVDMTTDKTTTFYSSDKALAYMNGYDNTVNNNHRTLPVLTQRDLTLIPNFISYEKA
ncbi:Phage tail protein [Vibrio crassostreae]|uniref:hypothetical protein n=1 Tax=Vibrio crassostreae TaxID=246167 RepID=UPI0010465811|nr:hypothetical protein [Vibrio crassostreae]TCN93931.1 hypothetical protein EDB51_12188 [Vibrio crassostreae]CAK1887440.1 Phage tail protein [Vibrio crassostreae]CAK1986234.1 Phage tail protein [Vibrio crassostreae]CAK2739656.1 Phage tail protein [Vibrio crassostreae]CAK2856512.1 Phage tail protein [Vibrio crassostreae]